MAVKTITIDLEAYEALARRKRDGQSFSEVIKEHFAGGSTGQDLLDAVRRVTVATDTIAAVEGQIKARRRSRARIPRW
jgi:predicted CopG family antitoxin